MPHAENHCGVSHTQTIDMSKIILNYSGFSDLFKGPLCSYMYERWFDCALTEKFALEANNWKKIVQNIREHKREGSWWDKTCKFFGGK